MNFKNLKLSVCNVQTTEEIADRLASDDGLEDYTIERVLNLVLEVIGRHLKLDEGFRIMFEDSKELGLYTVLFKGFCYHLHLLRLFTLWFVREVTFAGYA